MPVFKFEIPKVSLTRDTINLVYPPYKDMDGSKAQALTEAVKVTADVLGRKIIGDVTLKDRTKSELLTTLPSVVTTGVRSVALDRPTTSTRSSAETTFLLSSRAAKTEAYKACLAVQTVTAALLERPTSAGDAIREMATVRREDLPKNAQPDPLKEATDLISRIRAGRPSLASVLDKAAAKNSLVWDLDTNSYRQS